MRKVGDTMKCYGHEFHRESWGILVKKWIFSSSEYYKTKRHATLNWTIVRRLLHWLVQSTIHRSNLRFSPVLNWSNRCVWLKKALLKLFLVRVPACVNVSLMVSMSRTMELVDLVISSGDHRRWTNFVTWKDSWSVRFADPGSGGGNERSYSHAPWWDS